MTPKEALLPILLSSLRNRSVEALTNKAESRTDGGLQLSTDIHYKAEQG